MPTHTYQQQTQKQQKQQKRKKVYLMATPHIPKNLKSKKKWAGGANRSLNKRQTHRLEAKALRDYQNTLGLLPNTRITEPQTTKELCQDSLGILEEISEHGFNENRYLQLSNHLMNIHKKAAENEQCSGDYHSDFYHSNIGSVHQEFWDDEEPLSPVPNTRVTSPEEIVNANVNVNRFADMQTNDLIRNYIRLATLDARELA